VSRILLAQNARHFALPLMRGVRGHQIIAVPRTRRLDGRLRLARKLAELASVHYDLLIVERLCRRFDKEIRSRNLDPLVASALSIAAIVRYGRTFGSGVRPPIPPALISTLPKTLQKAHRRCKALRDKWAAHSVNDMEETRVVFEAIPKAPQSVQILAVFEEHQLIASVSDRDMRLLAQLCRALNERLGPEIIRERSRVLEMAQAMSPGEMARLKRATWTKLGRYPEKARPTW